MDPSRLSSCLSPATPSAPARSATISSRSPYANCLLSASSSPPPKACIPFPGLSEVLSSKKWRRCAASPRRVAVVAKAEGKDRIRSENGASNSEIGSMAAVTDGHRGRNDERPQEFPVVAKAEAKDRIRSENGASDSTDGHRGQQELPRSNFAVELQSLGSSLQDDVSVGSNGDRVKEERMSYSFCHCSMCGRRGLMTSLGGLIASSWSVKAASASNFESSDYNTIREAVHPARPMWYEKFYAQSMAKTMVSYEAEVADYKRRLFHNLDGRNIEHILELGIGTGPNLKYYGNMPRLQRVVGLDPNLEMTTYCTESATAAGLSDSQFEFIHAVGEGIPVHDNSMDAVVCTLTLCSVTDVTSTLEEVKRVLRPGGAFLFVEHVAAPEGTGLRFWQGLLDPLQQWVADGCHLTRDTLQYIDKAQFASLSSENFTVASVSLIGPHIMGVAYK